MDATAFEASIAIFFAVFIVIHQLKNHSFNCPTNTIHRIFSMEGLVILSCTDFIKVSLMETRI